MIVVLPTASSPMTIIFILMSSSNWTDEAELLREGARGLSLVVCAAGGGERSTGTFGIEYPDRVMTSRSSSLMDKSIL